MKYTLLAILIVVYLNCFSQNKVGNLTLSDSLFNAYILDCYKHPDTIPQSISMGKYDENEANKFLKSQSIGEIRDSFLVKAYVDTVFGNYLVKQVDYRKYNHPKMIIRHHAAHYQVYWLNYLIPRKPTEIDFIKWFKKQHK